MRMAIFSSYLPFWYPLWQIAAHCVCLLFSQAAFSVLICSFYIIWINLLSITCTAIFFLRILGLHLQHMEVPGLGDELELQPPAYATATAMQDPNHICDLHHSSQQCCILNPLSEARDQTSILTETSQVLHLWSHSGNSPNLYFKGCITYTYTS